MLIKTKYPNQYFCAVEFLRICNRTELKKVFEKHELKETFRKTKDKEELCNAIFEHLNSWGWSDMEIIEEVLKQRDERYFVHYVDEAKIDEEYFLVYDEED